MIPTTKIGMMQSRILPKRLDKLQVFPTVTWQEEFQAAKELGFDYIELLFDRDQDPANPLVDCSKLETLVSVKKETGIETPSICADYFTKINFLTDPVGQIKINYLVDCAEKLNVFNIIIPFFDVNQLANKEALVEFLNKASDIIRQAKLRNIQISIETDLPASEMKAALAETNSLAKICYDLGNAQAMGFNLEEEILLLNDLISLVHIKDRQNNQGPNVFLGDGDVNFVKAVQTLEKINYQGNFTLETAIGTEPRQQAAIHLEKARSFFKKEAVISSSSFKGTKTLFIGLGSIGQRHLQNLKTLAPTGYSLSAYRTSQKQTLIKDGQAKPVNSLAEHYSFQEFNDWQEALNQNPEISFICNPSQFHTKIALELAKTGSALFIEKPLGTDLESINELEKICREKNLVTLVGYQTRFHPFTKKIKKVLDNQQLGNIVSAQFNWSTYLPDHHKYENYREGYAARKDLGGGVIFCLCHELDLLQYFCGLPNSVYVQPGGPSKLKMDVEDTVSALFECQQANRNFPVSVHLSFTQGLERRNFTILLEDGVIECDWQANLCRIIKHDQTVVYQEDLSDFQRNQLFLDEIQYFLDCIKEKKQTTISVAEGKKSVQMALAMHQSLKTKRIINLENRQANNQALSQQYDAIYKDGAYQNFFTYNFFPAEKLILEMMPQWNNLEVLDVGCGEGNLAAMLSFAGAKKVTAVDYSEEAIKLAKSRINLENVNFVLSDFQQVQNRFDVLVMNGVLEHFDQPFEDLKYMLDNLLKEDGCIISTSPSFLNPRGYVWMALQLLLDVPMSLSDLHFLCPFDFEEFCQKHGYQLEIKSTDQDWGAGKRTIVDFQKRLTNALRDASLPNEKVNQFLNWFDKALPYFKTDQYSGATICYKIFKKSN